MRRLRLALAQRITAPTLDIVIQWITLLTMHTIVEMPEFLRRAEALISEDEKQEIINYIAATY